MKKLNQIALEKGLCNSINTAPLWDKFLFKTL